ncbi:MAG TPA: hypothetical protein VMH82_17665 [Myxococcota bacterium]|nr:hypothetical protein [Myxococcota bacterium]
MERAERINGNAATEALLRRLETELTELRVAGLRLAGVEAADIDAILTAQDARPHPPEIHRAGLGRNGSCGPLRDLGAVR